MIPSFICLSFTLLNNAFSTQRTVIFITLFQYKLLMKDLRRLFMKIMKIMLSDWLAKETGIDKRVIKVRFYNLTKLAYKVVYENKVHYLPMSLTRILSVEDTGSLVFEDKDYEHMLIYVDMDLINTNKYPNIQTISSFF